MAWLVEVDDAFSAEFDALREPVQDAISRILILLESYGPGLGRPHVDTLVGSRHANMKELRVRADNGVWRIAFAFDPLRRAVILVAGDKAGVSEKRFYRMLIALADERFARHLRSVGG